MIVNRAYKTELDLNNRQATLCRKHAGTARFAYNWGLDQKNKEYMSTGRSPNIIELNRRLNALKETDFPWMYEVSKCCPQEALRDLDIAFKNYFQHRAERPRFKSKKDGCGSFRLKESIRATDRTIQLPRLGTLRLKEHGYIPQNVHILSATVSEQADRWYVSVLVKENIVVPDNCGPVCGVDMGITHLATVSDGTVIDNPKALKSKERKLRRLQQNLSRTQKGSRNRDKARGRVAKLYQRISNIRSDAIHKATTMLTKIKSVVGLEDLDISGMLKNHYIARTLSDAGLGEFSRQMEYKSVWYGSRIVRAEPFYPSSKRCAQCGNIKFVLPLSERTYRCDVCGNIDDRDHNASLNLEWVAVSSTETLNACGDDVRPRGFTLGQLSMNQELNTGLDRNVLSG